MSVEYGYNPATRDSSTITTTVITAEMAVQRSSRCTIESQDLDHCRPDWVSHTSRDCRPCLGTQGQPSGPSAYAHSLTITQKRLNIPDMPMGGFAAAPAAQAAPAAVEEEEAAPAAQEKTLFNLKLQKFDAAQKPKIIKEIKGMLGLSLVDSKKFVESAPKLMKESVPKEEAEKIVAALKAVGGEVVME